MALLVLHALLLGEDIWHRKLTKIHSFGPNFLTSFYNRTLGTYNLVSLFWNSLHEAIYSKAFYKITKWETFNMLHFICNSQAEPGSLSPFDAHVWRKCSNLLKAYNSICGESINSTKTYFTPTKDPFLRVFLVLFLKIYDPFDPPKAVKSWCNTQRSPTIIEPLGFKD